LTEAATLSFSKPRAEAAPPAAPAPAADSSPQSQPRVNRGAASRPRSGTSPKWPKYVPPLTPEQERIGEDFLKYWLRILPRKFSIVERFNHGYPVWHAPRRFLRTLEIGAGLGEHFEHEPLTEEQARNYYALDLRPNLMKSLQQRFPQLHAITGDCQQKLAQFPDGFFDRILAVHVLEHLPNLPAAVREAHRLCDKERGVFSVVIPCEGSLAYTLARRISAQRIFEKRYNQSYHWYISREHINRPHEILEELQPYFATAQRSFFPLLLPVTECNLCIGLTLRPRKDAPATRNG
jgi:SAM-dependent methyltransferase